MAESGVGIPGGWFSWRTLTGSSHFANNYHCCKYMRVEVRGSILQKKVLEFLDRVENGESEVQKFYILLMRSWLLSPPLFHRFLFFFKFYFILEYSWFTMLCYFQMYSKVTRLYIYIYPFFFSFFSYIGYYGILIRVPCAIQ